MQHHRLSSQLEHLLKSDGQALSVGLLLERVGDRGFGLLLLIFSLPSALPIPAPGYSIPFGILLWIIGVQMIAGKPRPVLPARAMRRTLSPEMSARMLKSGVWFFRKVEWFVRPRLQWAGQRGGRIFMGVLVLMMATLMLIPIPFTNSMPALVIFLIAIGITEEDGLFAIAASIVGIIAAIFYGILVFAVIYYGPEAIVTMREYISCWWDGE